MEVKFEIEDLYDEDGESVDAKVAIRNAIIESISTKVLHDLSAPSYKLKQEAEKLINENIHSFVVMGIERFVQEKCTSINKMIDDKVKDAFDSSGWNNEGLPNLIKGKIESLVKKRGDSFDYMVKNMFEENFKVIVEELLDTAFKQFVEKAGINTIWVSGKERIKSAKQSQ